MGFFNRKKDNNGKEVAKGNSSFDLEALTSGLDIDNIGVLSGSDLGDLKNSNEAELDAAIKSFSKRQVDVMFVFDRSGSCAGTELDMMRGFNNFIKHEKDERNEDFITVSLFDHENKVVYDRTPVKRVKGLEYQVRGNTALYDSLCENLKSLQRKKDDNTEVIVVIMTDGADNSSHEYDIDKTRGLISGLKRQGWNFIFLGAMDYAKDYAAELGIDEKYAEIYSPEAVDANFKAIERVADDVHGSGKVSEDWAEPVVEARLQIEGRKDNHVKRLGRRK